MKLAKIILEKKSTPKRSLLLALALGVVSVASAPAAMAEHTIDLNIELNQDFHGFDHDRNWDGTYYRCTTESRGITFNFKDYDLRRAQGTVVEACTRDSRTVNAECRARLYCQQEREYQPPTPPVNQGYTCTTVSRGITFRHNNFDLGLAQQTVVQSCVQDRRTYSEECRRNVSCTSNGYNGPVNPGYPSPGPVRPGPVYPGPVRPGPVFPGPVRPGPINPPTPVMYPVELQYLPFFQNYCRFSYQNAELVNIDLYGAQPGFSWKCQDQRTGQVYPISVEESCRLYGTGVPRATCNNAADRYCWQCATY